MVGGTIASVLAASTATSRPEPASALGTAVARRPASKRSPVFLCNDAVSYLQNPSKQSEVWLVGTAHISNSSAEVSGADGLVRCFGAGVVDFLID